MSTKIKTFLKKLGEKISNILFPNNIKCIFCNADVADFENKPYCDDCEKELTLNNGNKCQICSEPIGNEATVCDNCQKHKRSFKKAFCPFVYDGKVRSAILAYKDSNKRYMAKPFAKLIVDEILESKITIDVISYVPLSKKKFNKRGFNQAKLLAEEISKRLNVECKCLFEKVKDIKTQKLSTFKERQENTVGMYKYIPGNLKRSENLLIVDDIITTCATIDACSKLVEKRCSNVYVAAIARNKLKKQII